MRLKPHLQVVLEIHDITPVEVARHKENSIENMKWSKVERVYSRRRFSQDANTDNTKYIPLNICEGEKTNL